jgi:peptide deformylase
LALRQILNMDDNEAELRRVSRPVTKFDDRLCELVDDLLETLHANENGAGLAAPQVGVLRRVAVIDLGEGPIELINPVILETDGEMEVEEGCLSLPGRYLRTRRPARVRAEAYDRTGEKRAYEGEGLLALALVHEIGHLDGELFIDYRIDDIAGASEGED